MEAIAAGKEKKPKPSMLEEGGALEADAICDSNHFRAAEEREAGTTTAVKAKATTNSRLLPSAPDPIGPSSLRRSGAKTLRVRHRHVDGSSKIKFDGYRIQNYAAKCQCTRRFH